MTTKPHDVAVSPERMSNPPKAQDVVTPVVTYNPECPWMNRKDPLLGVLPPADAHTRDTFLHVLRHQLSDAKLADIHSGQPPNLYPTFGFASQGYRDWAAIEARLRQWCDQNDKRHRLAGTGWILVTQGDGDYGHHSIETIAQYVRGRGVPVVFVQSHFGYAEPHTPYWPTYASAGFFGEGYYHDQPKRAKDGTVRYTPDGTVMQQEAWGGVVRDSTGSPVQTDGEEMKLAFPDAALLGSEEFGGEKLRDYIGGMFVAGGGAITCEQVDLYNFSSRCGDCFVPALAIDGTPSLLNARLASTSIVNDEASQQDGVLNEENVPNDK